MATRSGSKQTTKKKNTTSRAKTASKARTQKAKRQSAPMDVAIRSEIILIILCAVCILLFLCNLGLIGTIGNMISSIMFGIFGTFAYLFPIVLFLGIAFFMSNFGNTIATRKLVAGLVLCLLFMMICEIFSSHLSKDSVLTAKQIYENCADNKRGGGIVGGALALLCVKTIGVGGVVLLLIVLTIICIIVITEKSFIEFVSNQGRNAYDRSREDLAYRKELQKERQKMQMERRAEQLAMREQMQAERKKRDEELQEEKRNRAEEKENDKILRMEKKVSGVILDTALEKKKVLSIEDNRKNRDGIHEITLMDDEIVEDEATVQNENYESAAHSIIHTSEQIHEIKADVTAVPTFTLPEADFSISEGYSPIIRKDGITYDTDNAFYGEGADNKPEDSFAIETGNQMEIDCTVPKVKATLGEHKEPPTKLRHTELNADDRLELIKNASMEQNKKPMGEAPKRTVISNRPYKKPPLNLLKQGNAKKGDTTRELRETADHLQKTLATFGVNVTITEISQGPSVTRYEMQPEQGVKVSKIVGLQDDIKLNLAATDIRIEAPIPGKAAVGIEVPNKENSAVALRDLLETKEYQDSKAGLAFAVGKDIGGQTVVTDIAKMPHMLIAGSTGSGKSVCINTIIMSILFKYNPDDVKLIMIDPKVVELSVYNGIPHLLIPVVTDPKKASAALHWAVAEMTERYNKFAEWNVRDLKGYNQKAKELRAKGDPSAPEKDMPLILIIVDELADLMMVAPGEVEESICRLAQLARAAGIHLIIATQRPSVDVITGLIKANMPSRAAFAVSSGVDSRTILDMNGAEKLLGKGDMLFYPQGYTKPARIQGAFVSDGEVSAIVEFLKEQMYISSYGNDVETKLQSIQSNGNASISASGDAQGSQYDPLFADAGHFIIEKDKASIGMLQRVFKIGFNRAARIMDQLCEVGLVGEEEGTKPRKILMSPEQFEQILEELL